MRQIFFLFKHNQSNAGESYGNSSDTEQRQRLVQKIICKQSRKSRSKSHNEHADADTEMLERLKQKCVAKNEPNESAQNQKDELRSGNARPAADKDNHCKQHHCSGNKARNIYINGTDTLRCSGKRHSASRPEDGRDKRAYFTGIMHKCFLSR